MYITQEQKILFWNVGKYVVEKLSLVELILVLSVKLSQNYSMNCKWTIHKLCKKNILRHTCCDALKISHVYRREVCFFLVSFGTLILSFYFFGTLVHLEHLFCSMLWNCCEVKQDVWNYQRKVKNKHFETKK